MTTVTISRTQRWLMGLGSWPFYVFLLPLFFVVHGVKENFGFIGWADIAPLLLLYEAAALILYLLSWWLLKTPTRAGLISFLLLSVFFFFGAIQDFFKAHWLFASRYIVLLPFFALAIVLIAVLIRKRKDLGRLTLFINLLLTIYLIVDLATIAFKLLFPATDKFSVYSFTGKHDYFTCAACAKPDIYFLLFDEYASSKNLRENFHYDNSELDSFLLQQKFHIQADSRGNYNFTPFSMTSILNMSYISGIQPDAVSADDYARCNKLIRENELTRELAGNGYDIVNYSIFDIAGNPSPVDQDILPLKARLLTDRTLWGRMKKDLLWNLFTGRFELKWLTNDIIYINRKNNEKIIAGVEKEALKKTGAPRFIYAHCYMPHPPYYFDQSGQPRSKEELLKRDDGDKNAYLANVHYTNGKIIELVTAIQQHTQGKAVIIIMGDHGFRYDPNFPKAEFFQNQNAVYFPSQNYSQLYDSITGVNQFRVVLNTLFDARKPLLKDSTSFLTDQ